MINIHLFLPCLLSTTASLSVQLSATMRLVGNSKFFLNWKETVNSVCLRLCYLYSQFNQFRHFVVKTTDFSIFCHLRTSIFGEEDRFFVFWSSLPKATSPLHGFICKTRMHSSRMRTARRSSRPGGSPPGLPWSRHTPPGTPPEQTPPPWTESQTPVKIKPCPNFVAGGNNNIRTVFSEDMRGSVIVSRQKQEKFVAVATL